MGTDFSQRQFVKYLNIFGYLLVQCSSAKLEVGMSDPTCTGQGGRWPRPRIAYRSRQVLVKEGLRYDDELVWVCRGRLLHNNVSGD